MSDIEAANSVIEYAHVSADEVRLARYLRLLLGGAILFYGGCGTVASIIYFATLRGLLNTKMTYPSYEATASMYANAATMVALTIAGPCILWGSRGLLIVGGILTRITSAMTVVIFAVSWMWSLGIARSTSTNFDSWHWFASFVGGVAYLAFPVLVGLMAMSPCFPRILATAKR